MKTNFNLDKLIILCVGLSIVAYSSSSIQAQGLIGFDKETEIFKVVDEMPRFYDRLCEKLDDAERTKCAESALFNYLKKNIRYPSLAVENKTEGNVYVQFVVNEDGSISNIETLKDIGENCGDAAVKLLKDMPTWIPGIQNGQRVKVYYTLPVKFQLR